jgi:hypothetical protein
MKWTFTLTIVYGRYAGQCCLLPPQRTQMQKQRARAALKIWQRSDFPQISHLMR